jgi:hypothetical protein
LTRHGIDYITLTFKRRLDTWQQHPLLKIAF